MWVADINCATTWPAVWGWASVARPEALESKFNLGWMRPALQVVASHTKWGHLQKCKNLKIQHIVPKTIKGNLCQEILRYGKSDQNSKKLCGLRSKENSPQPGMWSSKNSCGQANMSLCSSKCVYVIIPIF